MATTHSKKRAAHESPTQLLMKHCKMSRESVDAMSDAVRTQLLSIASLLEQKDSLLEQKDSLLEQIETENRTLKATVASQKTENRTLKATVTSQKAEIVHKDSLLQLHDNVSIHRLLRSPLSLDFRPQGNMQSHTASTAKHRKATPTQRENNVKLQEIKAPDEMLASASLLLKHLTFSQHDYEREWQQYDE